MRIKRIMRRMIGLMVVACLIGAAVLADSAYAAGETYKVTAGSLKVRSEPSTKAQVVGGLKAGETVTATQEKNGWLRIKVGRLTGWASAAYLAPAGNTVAKTSSGAANVKAPDEAGSAGSGAASAEAGGSEAGTAGNDAQPEASGDADAAATGEAGNASDDAGASGEAVEQPDAAGEDADAPDATGVVMADALRVRSGAGLTSKIVGVLYQDETVTVLEKGDGWLRVESAVGLTGWVSAQYVSTKGPASEKPQAKVEGPLSGTIITVDPGHGGTDPGMVGTKHGTYEKELNLSTSRYLAEELEKLGAKVILTRTKDEQKPGLSERVRIAEEAGSNAFVSVHYNSSPKKVSGTLSFYYSDKKDKPLAAAIEKRLADAGTGLKSNGFAYGNYHVLRENDVPSALVELGFLTNEKDEELVRTEAYQRAAAKAIALGLQDYLQS